MLGVLAGALTGIMTLMATMMLFGRDLLDSFHDLADEVNHRAVWILLTLALLIMLGMWAGWSAVEGAPLPGGYLG
jgi:hypothetical protein